MATFLPFLTSLCSVYLYKTSSPRCSFLRHFPLLHLLVQNFLPPRCSFFPHFALLFTYLTIFPLHSPHKPLPSLTCFCFTYLFKTFSLSFFPSSSFLSLLPYHATSDLEGKSPAASPLPFSPLPFFRSSQSISLSSSRNVGSSLFFFYLMQLEHLLSPPTPPPHASTWPVSSALMSLFLPLCGSLLASIHNALSPCPPSPHPSLLFSFVSFCFLFTLSPLVVFFFVALSSH